MKNWWEHWNNEDLAQEVERLQCTQQSSISALVEIIQRFPCVNAQYPDLRDVRRVWCPHCTALEALVVVPPGEGTRG